MTEQKNQEGFKNNELHSCETSRSKPEIHKPTSQDQSHRGGRIASCLPTIRPEYAEPVGQIGATILNYIAKKVGRYS